MAYNPRRGGPGMNRGFLRPQQPLMKNFIPANQNQPAAPITQQQRFTQMKGCLKQESASFKQPQPQQQVKVQPPSPLINETFESKILKDEDQKKSFWNSIRAGKVTRKERQRRRNLRLSKILQPKNALTILNELVKSAPYTVTDHPDLHNKYSATVVVDGVTHVGQGCSKAEAKSGAAEAALKHIVKNRQFSTFPKTENAEVDDPMEGGEEGETQGLPWQHVASFALYKLLNSWGEDFVQKKGAQENGPVQVGPKPSKKLPENAAQMNPLMLMNQMLPHAAFEELERKGNSPNMVFTFKCTVNGLTFTGKGPNKKTAKKFAAFAACQHILKIDYPTDVYTPAL